MVSKRGRGPYPPEFREEAVRLYRASGRSLAKVEADLDVSIESLRSWVKQDESDLGEREGLNSDESGASAAFLRGRDRYAPRTEESYAEAHG